MALHMDDEYRTTSKELGNSLILAIVISILIEGIVFVVLVHS